MCLHSDALKSGLIFRGSLVAQSTTSSETMNPSSMLLPPHLEKEEVVSLSLGLPVSRKLSLVWTAKQFSRCCFTGSVISKFGLESPWIALIYAGCSSCQRSRMKIRVQLLSSHPRSRFRAHLVALLVCLFREMLEKLTRRHLAHHIRSRNAESAHVLFPWHGPVIFNPS